MKAKAMIPCIGYKDAPAAIEWLCKAFGFEKHLIVPGKNNTIEHAQLTLGDAMIMTGSSNHDRPYSNLTNTPLENGGKETQSPYVILDDSDLDAHYKMAKAAGAKIIMELKEEDYGGRNYTCYDIEGHLWNFGSYDPWKDNQS